MVMANTYKDSLVLETAMLKQEQSQGVSQELSTVNSQGAKAPGLALPVGQELSGNCQT